MLSMELLATGAEKSLLRMRDRERERGGQGGE